jgi:hypothetical protein
VSPPDQFSLSPDTRHQVIDIPPIQAEVIEHRLHRLLCPRCSTSTCAELPQGVESSHYGPRLSPWWVCWAVRFR